MTHLARSRRGTISLAVVTAVLPFTWPVPTGAQSRAATRDSLRLGTLHAEAVRRDPRGQQLELLASQSALRQRNLDAERLPALSVGALGLYQLDLLTTPLQLPGAAAVPRPPHVISEAHLAARQALYDPARGPRRDLERARLAESQARVRASLHGLRQGVNDAFFTALLSRAQGDELETGLADLEAQLGVARARVRLGSALPSEAATLEAELLRRRQSLAELAASRDAALVVLGDFTGRTVTAADPLVLPDLGAQVAAARDTLGAVRGRPEYQLFARSREVLDRQQESTAAQDRPRVSAFGLAGYGRLGLNPLAADFDDFWLAGVQVAWAPWTWGTTRRERQELAIQQRIVATEEAAFTESVRRAVASDLAAVDRLARTLALDDEIIALRERILRETRLRFGEGVVTSAEYVDRETDLLAARLARATHRVELARASARFLTLIGVEVR